MGKEYIVIRGAKEHNLKSVNVEIPRDALVVITGLSGSGKSSLAFDTIYAEGQRRYVESLSAYARQFLGQMQKPDVEHIEGLSPAVAIEQRTAGANPRSTVGTQTEIYDYLRLLFARIGVAHCFICGRKVTRLSSQEIISRILTLAAGQQIQILAPLVRGRKGEFSQLFERIRKEGFIRVRIDGTVYDLSSPVRHCNADVSAKGVSNGASPIQMDKRKKHTIEVVVDRIALRADIKKRLADSVETALGAGNGVLIIHLQSSGHDVIFSELYACLECGVSYGELEPRMFSFNSPYGACKECSGLGTKMEIDPDLIVPDKTKSLREGAIEPWKKATIRTSYYSALLKEVAHRFTFGLDKPFGNLKPAAQKMILYGGDEVIWGKKWEGVIPNLQRRLQTTEREAVRNEIGKYLSTLPCPACKGTRLKPESLATTIADKSIAELTKLSIAEAKDFFAQLELTKEERAIAQQILEEIHRRLAFLAEVGLDYLTLERNSATLSGGEAQRIRLATQIGAGLAGVLYILDEPSIGLHQRDNGRLLSALKELRDLGNTVLIVEHDETTIRSADHIIDLGPGPGQQGGEVVAQGSLAEILSCERSLTAQYLNGQRKIEIPTKRRKYEGRAFLEIEGCREHNLKNINVKIPLGLFICVTGVSGSGKSTLVEEILYRSLAQALYRSKQKPGEYDRIKGIEHIDKVIIIDQSPIGRSPRSNPATYTGIFTDIRVVFSKIPESRLRGYRPGRFSFNTKGGRCEACLGDGIKRIEMYFLPDVYTRCEICKGRRFNEQTLEVRYKGKSIADVLEMSVDEAKKLFENIPHISSGLQRLIDVGLGYIKLGQPATTLSGGEAQRVKLATELSKRSTGKTFYLLDEPTTGLHFADIDRLLSILQQLVDNGNTVLVIEHNLDVVKCADYIIDLGPEGGDDGGWVIATGTPEKVAEARESYTGRYLKKHLNRYSRGGKIEKD